jgi:hypothetical protein
MRRQGERRDRLGHRQRRADDDAEDGKERHGAHSPVEIRANARQRRGISRSASSPYSDATGIRSSQAG